MPTPDFDAPLLPIELIETGNLPTVILSSGLQPIPPATLRAQLVEIVSRTNPDYTANLPGTLVEDIVSTDTQAMVMIDQARVEALNSLTPYGCNEFVLMLLGKVYGVPIGQPTNTSVYVVFTGDPGFVVGKGFTVSDGNFQYILQDGGVIGDSGESQPLFAVAPTPGAWAVPAGTVTALITPPPSGFPLTVTNPIPGFPAISAESATQYRARVLRAGLAGSQGMPRYLRTLLSNVPGVNERLIGIQQRPAPDGGWMIIVGGSGDPYDIAYTIYQALFDISTLVGSVTHVVSITNDNPALATTDIPHGFSVGDTFHYANTVPTEWVGDYRVFSVPSPTSFTMGVAYLGGPITAATWAAGVITFTTLDPHGLAPGALPVTSNFVPDAYSSLWPPCTVISPTVFTVPRAGNPGAVTTLGDLNPGLDAFDGAGKPPYVGGGSVTPNHRNVTTTIIDYPDSYPIIFVLPPQQSLAGTTVRWNTNSPNFVSAAAVAQAAAQPLADYINSITVGKPINILQMSDVFQNAIVSILPPAYLTRLDIDIAIDGVVVPVNPGTHIVEGDPQGYFFATAVDFTIVQDSGP